MIQRYTRSEMGAIWKEDQRFSYMLEVEKSVADAQGQMGIIPAKAAKKIRQKGQFHIRRIHEIEQVTKHDVIAFVSSVAESIGDEGRFVHYGMTSSDILDTAFSLQVRSASQILIKGIDELKQSLIKLVQSHKSTLCPGRTHGMFAEPTTFGYKLAGHLKELVRNEIRLKGAIQQFSICKLSGAVGTYSSMGPELEKRVAKKLKLEVEEFATQVIPRDRHAHVMWSLCSIGNGLERLAIELRHLQRSDVQEVCEGFTRGQKGSSAMPHKKNPISAENITGCSRLLRGYLTSCLENVSLWHERDISHSSVERVIFPDAFIICDYALYRMKDLLDNLDVNKSRMIQNLESSQGQIYSSHLLLLLVQSGLSREEAYSHVQRLCHSLGYGDHLKDKFSQDTLVGKLVPKKKIEELFNGKIHQRIISNVISSRVKRNKKK